MKKIKKAPKLRAQKLDGANLALQFLYKLKIEMELKPSPENIIDQDEKLILGLIWGLMRKFVRFSDDDEGTRLRVCAFHFQKVCYSSFF